MINYLKFVLLLLVTIFFIGCDEKDELSSFPEVVNEYQPPVLDVNENLSSVNFKNLVLQNESFQLKLNDNLTLTFNDIKKPVIDDPEEDVVYSAADNKGFIALSDGLMSFIYFDEDYSIKGSLYNNLSEKIEYKEILRGRKKQLSKEGYTLIDNHKKGGDENYSLIEYSNNKKQTKTTPSKKEKSLGCNVSNDFIKSVKTPSLTRARDSKKRKIKIKVYTLKKLSNTDINYAMIHVRNSLKSVFSSTDPFYKKISTYFGAAKDGKKIVPFDGDKTTASTYNNGWATFAKKTLPQYYYYKSLLLTDFNTTGGVTGGAYSPGSSAWSNLCAWSHKIPAHEVGHMFGAKHTGIYYKGGWWRSDVMFNSQYADFTTIYDTHENAKNVDIILENIDKILE
jgi:hypothetical protein